MRELIKDIVIASIVIVGIVIFAILALVSCTPQGHGAINEYFYEVQKVDDKTNYKTLKKVEDTCRTMIASYESDKLTYEQYKEDDNVDKQEWAEQAKMRANKTASTYNNYVLENSFVWEDAVPTDIQSELPYLD